MSRESRRGNDGLRPVYRIIAEELDKLLARLYLCRIAVIEYAEAVCKILKLRNTIIGGEWDGELCECIRRIIHGIRRSPTDC